MVSKKLALVATVFAFVISAYASEAGDGRRGLSFGLQYDPGFVLPTNEFVKGDNANCLKMKHFNAYTLTANWQTDGSHEWEHIHNFPSFGAGLYTATFDNSAEIGQPVALFGYVRGLFFRRNFTALHYNIDLGLAANWTCFDHVSNTSNIAIGTPLTAHIGLGLELSQTLWQRCEVAVGLAVTHFSNGSTKKPNKGLNLFSPHIRLAILLDELRLPTRILWEKTTGNELQLMLGAGTKCVEADLDEHPELADAYPDGARFFASSTQIAFMRRYAPKGKFGGGLSVIYDESLGSVLHATSPTSVSTSKGATTDRFALGIFAAHEFCIDRLSIVTQIGFDVVRNAHASNQKSIDFQRLGARYTFRNDLFAGVNIVANRFKYSDFIEWNVGYVIPLLR